MSNQTGVIVATQEISHLEIKLITTDSHHLAKFDLFNRVMVSMWPSNVAGWKAYNDQCHQEYGCDIFSYDTAYPSSPFCVSLLRRNPQLELDSGVGDTPGRRLHWQWKLRRSPSRNSQSTDAAWPFIPSVSTILGNFVRRQAFDFRVRRYRSEWVKNALASILL